MQRKKELSIMRIKRSIIYIKRKKNNNKLALKMVILSD